MKKKLILITLIMFITGIVILMIDQPDNVKKSSKKINATIAIFVGETKINEIPTKESGYHFDKTRSSCSNGTLIDWDSESWSPIISNVTMTKTKCSLYFRSEYKESILNGTDPILMESLIPITIANDGTVTKADIEKKWYSYAEKQWANAIFLEDESVTYQIGDIIPESNIESYFVWIPRYRYQIFNEGNYSHTTSYQNQAQTIKIEFETKETVASTGSKVGTWLTHPAFTSLDTNGMWVGKYETGYKNANSDESARANIVDESKIWIKPNVYSWTGIQIANSFLSSYNYKRELDSHMMKNTEWGAVAYLSHSVYGSQQSIRMNNNSGYLTGSSANNEPTCGHQPNMATCNIYCNNGSCYQPYNTETGYLASTTANITGIYDMSGGAGEYVMGVMLDQSGNPMSGYTSAYNSGFKGSYGAGGSNTTGYDWPENKYFDKYSYGTHSVSGNVLYEPWYQRILGDATGEMGPFQMFNYSIPTSYQTWAYSSWYKDDSNTVRPVYPWFYRGSSWAYGEQAGIFAFNTLDGGIYNSISFRIVLSPN